MNKLEEYRDKVAMKLHDSEKGYYLSILDAFDAAIALDLPVKFAEWKVQECTLNNFSEKNWMFDGKWWSSKDLYQYWIDNIYKPE